MAKTWYEKTSGQVPLIVVTLATVSLLAYYWAGRASNTEVQTELVLSQTALALPGAASYGDDRFLIEIEKIPGSLDEVVVRVNGPGDLLAEWRQGLGRKAYRYGSDLFFVDILNVMHDKVTVTDVTVSISRKL